MTRSELIDALAEKIRGLAPEEVDRSVRALLDMMTEAIAAGDRIEIRGFGSFSLREMPPRTGRNPKTGAEVPLGAKRRTHFKPGKELRAMVDVPDPPPIVDGPRESNR